MHGFILTLQVCCPAADAVDVPVVAAVGPVHQVMAAPHHGVLLLCPAGLRGSWRSPCLPGYWWQQRQDDIRAVIGPRTLHQQVATTRHPLLSPVVGCPCYSAAQHHWQNYHCVTWLWQ